MTLPDPDRSRVVLIGTSRFTDPDLPDLPAVRNNLDGLAGCLRDIGRCTVVADPESTVALVDPVHDAAAAAEDTLLIYYAGHGLIHPRTLGLLLAVVGSAPGRTHTAVPYDLVRENVLDSPAARKVVILDCCYSGRALGGMADPTTALADEATVEGTYLLASAPPNKQALSPPGETYTAFTGALLTLFNQGVPNGPPLLQLDLIYRHVRDALKRAARPEPQLRADNTAGELALVRNPWHQPLRPLTPLLDVPMVTLSTWRLAEAENQANRKQVRERIKELVREAGMTESYACPACQATVSGQNLVRHFDKHSPIESASLDPATLTLIAVTTLLGNRYQLHEPLGNSGKVHRATDTLMHRTVVVKQMPTPLTTVRLEHPAIVLVLGTVETSIVMEYIDGQTLGEVLLADGAMGHVEAVKIMIEVCSALAYAHQQGVIHGEVNSRNVMLTRDGAVKILNFGSGDAPALRSDLYFAGRLLSELLTGLPVAFSSLVPPQTPALDKVLRRAVHPDLAERYPTATAMRDDLLAVLR